MPTYSYRCTECSNAFDIHQSFTDDSLTVCPTCGGVLRMVFSPVGVTFSGSGFYRTDSRAAAGAGEVDSFFAVESFFGAESPEPEPAESPEPLEPPDAAARLSVR
ncbi:MAG: FmdB family zinc ribbon protein [Rhodoglobus sp.]|nr:FmdB family zinc ribbon protein [Rhodoglobus sp.]